MWKDHSSVSEAELITRKAKEIRPEYLSICGGTYSSEWYFSKVFHCLSVDPQVFDSAYIWLEMVDYLPALLCGIDCVDDMKFSVCAAGHKAMFNESWGGFPDSSFWESIDPRLGEYRDRLPTRAYSSDHRAGELCVEWSRKLGLLGFLLPSVHLTLILALLARVSGLAGWSRSSALPFAASWLVLALIRFPGYAGSWMVPSEGD